MIHLDDLYRLKEGVETRWASGENRLGAKGSACLGNDGRKRFPCLCPLKAGETAVLAEATASPGMIRRIWSTISDRSPLMLRGLRLEMTWDGSEKPAVSVPFGDFFCHGLARMSPFENALFSSPEGRSFNCIIPMPFRTGARITVKNETERDLEMFFYDVNYTLGDRHTEEALYFHAHWRRENPTRSGEDYTILPFIRGRGRFLGSVSGVIASTERYFKSWWGEGEVKVYLDGDSAHPTLCGTGMEDYIGTGWGQGRYSHSFQGCPVADEERMQYSFYRLHVPDPIWFHQDIRVGMQQIGCWNPETIRQLHEAGISLRHGNHLIDTAAVVNTVPFGFFEREDDWCSCAWFYIDKPFVDLLPLPSLEQRLAGLEMSGEASQALA